jgi:hypothetical protein
MLNSGFYGYDYSDICQTSSHKTKLFKDLNLPPGEEVVLDMGLIETPYASYGQFNPAWRVCIWSSTPDGMVDVNHSNNMSCLLVSPVVSSAEPQIFSFSLFPNPASDVCTLTWGEDLRPENIRVYDIHGTLLLDEAADSSAGSHRLNLDTWPSGVYTVFLDKAVRRLVKM